MAQEKIFTKQDFISKLALSREPVCLATPHFFAPANIALCKYWGKSNEELHIPFTDSLSVPLGKYGALTSIALNRTADCFILNRTTIPTNSPFFEQVFKYLELFRPAGWFFEVNSSLNIPHSSGLASSAGGFAALTYALNSLFGWQANLETLSLISRLGSGSACRSFWPGWVWWKRGNDPLGFDSRGYPLRPMVTPNSFKIAIQILANSPKKYPSRSAMEQTKGKSRLFAAWAECVSQDLQNMRQAHASQNWMQILKIAERNTRCMHSLALDLEEPIVFSNIKSQKIIYKIWQLREKGFPIYYTQDAGPHIKILFLPQHEFLIKQHFKGSIIIDPFADS